MYTDNNNNNNNNNYGYGSGPNNTSPPVGSSTIGGSQGW